MDPLLLRLLTVLGVVLLATLLGRLWQREDGRVRVVSTAADARAALGLPATHDGPQAVLFGSATCAPCDTVKAVLEDVAITRPDFRWQYVDAAERLDLADAHQVRRVPTLLVIDERGTVVARTSGVPRRAELEAAIPSTRAALRAA